MGVFFKPSYLMPVALLLLCSRVTSFCYYCFLYRFILLHCYLLLIRLVGCVLYHKTNNILLGIESVC